MVDLEEKIERLKEKKHVLQEDNDKLRMLMGTMCGLSTDEVNAIIAGTTFSSRPTVTMEDEFTPFIPSSPESMDLLDLMAVKI